MACWASTEIPTSAPTLLWTVEVTAPIQGLYLDHISLNFTGLTAQMWYDFRCARAANWLGDSRLGSKSDGVDFGGWKAGHVLPHHLVFSQGTGYRGLHALLHEPITHSNIQTHQPFQRLFAFAQPSVARSHVTSHSLHSIHRYLSSGTTFPFILLPGRGNLSATAISSSTD